MTEGTRAELRAELTYLASVRRVVAERIQVLECVLQPLGEQGHKCVAVTQRATGLRAEILRILNSQGQPMRACDVARAIKASGFKEDGEHQIGFPTRVYNDLYRLSLKGSRGLGCASRYRNAATRLPAQRVSDS